MRRLASQAGQRSNGRRKQQPPGQYSVVLCDTVLYTCCFYYTAVHLPVPYSTVQYCTVPQAIPYLVELEPLGNAVLVVAVLAGHEHTEGVPVLELAPADGASARRGTRGGLPGNQWHSHKQQLSLHWPCLHALALHPRQTGCMQRLMEAQGGSLSSNPRKWSTPLKHGGEKEKAQPCLSPSALQLLGGSCITAQLRLHRWAG